MLIFSMNGDNLEKLKKKLYRPGNNIFQKRYERAKFFSRTKNTSSSWEDGKNDEALGSRKPKPSFLKTAGILAAILVVGGGLFFWFFLKGGLNIVSGRNIDISLQGPLAIDGGQPAHWRVGVINNNRTALDEADLIIEYPPEAVPEKSLLASPLRERIDLGKINSGQTAFADFSAAFYGQENSEAELKINVEYRPSGSSAVFTKSTVYRIKIATSPVAVSVSAPKEARDGQEVEFKIRYSATAKEAVKDLVLTAEYPSGFSLNFSSLKPKEKDNVWPIGDLVPNQENELTIKGVLAGQEQEEKNFKFSLGILDKNNQLRLYNFVTSAVLMRRAFLDVSVLFNNGDGQAVSLGDDIDISVAWRNNVPAAVRNVVLEVKLEGKTIDQSSIFVDKGFYRGEDNTLVWNASTLNDFSVIDPGQEGLARFRFSLVNSLSSQTVKDTNLTVGISAVMSVEKPPAGFEDFNLKGEDAKEIKVASKLQLASRALYYAGAFSNSGPLPPKVGQETSYTITWSLTNSLNVLKEVSVKSSLPPYIKWLGEVLPSEEKISYNSATGEVVWQAGEIPAGTGFFRPAKDVSFRVIFTPAFNQVGKEIVLVSETQAQAHDNFTGSSLSQKRSSLTTNLKDDPQFKYGQGEVIQ
ncbi:MAG: hypothetical protein UU71_C0003G0017 [Parcubacteria group bacterium GW2011_GWB1_41_6]|nr:MAG: hypothetical protein UU71_C0003G0017 [Parcubacteria group bacterium GW2011_GWB1_41_6]